VTDIAPPPAPVQLPPDPVQYDAVRNEHARKRGLQQAYIAGGDDPQLDETIERERPYLRYLVVMAIAIVAGGFILGIVSALLGNPI
jgi:hypothetical protein